VQDAAADRSGGDRVVTLLADPTVGDYGSYATGRMVLASGRTVSVRVNLPKDVAAHCWDRLVVTDAASQPPQKAQAYYAQRGLAGSISPSSADVQAPRGLLGAIAGLRNRTVAHLQAAGTPGAHLMAALVCGDRTALFQDAAYDDITAAGLAHMVAVSGAHLAIVCGLVGVLLTRLPRPLRTCSLIAFMLVYAVFAGCPASVLRASFMAALALCAAVAKRRKDALSALALCIVGFLALEPVLALSVSFALSCLSMLGIGLFYPLARAWAAALFRDRIPAVGDSLALTLTASLLTLPVSAPLFAQLSLVSPVSNLVVSPALGGLCALGLAAAFAMAFVPALVPALSSGLAFLGNLALAATHLCARVPHACVPVDVDLVSALAVAAALACALYRLWPRPSLATGLAGIAPCACAFLAAFVFAPFLHGSEIDMLDVGQGDAFVLRSGTRAVLIDTGTNDTDLLKGLARHDVRSLDAVVITHADDDHCGSLPALLKSVPVGVVIVAADLPTCPSESCAKLMGQLQDAPVEGVRAGDAFNWGAFTARVVSPDAYADEGGNADSLVLVVTADPDADGRDDVRALFCGDAEAEVLEPLAEAGAIPAVDILKVPHHGSKAGVTPELLGALAPRIGLISVGEGNRYGHPRPETIQALEDQGTVVARTDQEGDVVCELKADRIVLAPSRLH
jgi:competence protein ComEC